MDKRFARKIVLIILCSTAIVVLLAAALCISMKNTKPTGKLDNSGDLQRILKGVGVLELRILPTRGDLKISDDKIGYYVENLMVKGPGYTSDNQYVWCEIKNIREWSVPNSVIRQFGGKYYVLASNLPKEVLLHSVDKNNWKLKKTKLTTDKLDRRAIDFIMDEKGEKLIARVTGNNIGRPLCILLDGIAISAPIIQTKTQRIHWVWPDKQ